MRLHVIARFVLGVGMCAAKEAKCPISDSVVILEAKEETKTVKGKVSQAVSAAGGRLELYQSTNEKSTDPKELVALANTLLDWRWGDVEIRTQDAIKGPKLKLRWTPISGTCLDSAEFSVAQAPDEMWLDWKREIPVREGATKVAGLAGPGVKRVRMVVIAPWTAPDGGLESEVELNVDPKDAGVTVESKSDPKKRKRAALTHGIAPLRQQAVEWLLNSTTAMSLAHKEAPPEVQTNARRVECLSGEIEQTLDVVPKDGSFEVVLQRTIEAGQCVFIFPVKENGTPVTTEDRNFAVVRPAYQDWGRVQGTFFTGFAVGQASNSSSSGSPYLGFSVDGSILSRMLARPTDYKKPKCKDEQHATQQQQQKKGDQQPATACKDNPEHYVWGTDRAEKLLKLKTLGASANFFGEGRLTQSTNLKTDATSADGKSGTNQAQAVFFQAGLYTPFRITGMDWRHHGNLYSFFGAPLVKYGALWVNEGVVIGQKTVKEPDDTGSVTGKTFAGGSTATPVVAKGAQYFYGIGTRFGFMKYTLLGTKALNRQIRHDPIGYIDVTYGQNYALRTPGVATVTMEPLTGTPSTAAAFRTITTTGSTVDPRIAIESRVKLPNLPAFVGMDVNLNWKHPGQSVTDFRFVAGFRLDAAQAIGRAFGIGSK